MATRNDIDVYEKYRKQEDLPVKTTIIVPPDGIARVGIMQFHHGMGEHRGRYKHVLEYFSKKGFVCAIHDARGHGESMENDSELGYFGANGADIVVEDTHAVTVYLKNNYPDLPVILIGHSFGSMVVRAYVKKYDYEIDRLIVVGSPADNKFKNIGMLIVELMTIFNSEKKVSPFVANLFDGQFEKAYMKYCEEHKREYKKAGLICSVDGVVEAFKADRKCNFSYTLNGYYTIMDTMRRIYTGSPEKWVRKNTDMKIVFLSGRDDMYLGGEENFRKVVERMRYVGYKNVEYKMYDGMFHEILNEVEKEKVFEDIIENVKDICYATRP